MHEHGCKDGEPKWVRSRRLRDRKSFSLNGYVLGGGYVYTLGELYRDGGVRGGERLTVSKLQVPNVGI